MILLISNICLLIVVAFLLFILATLIFASFLSESHKLVFIVLYLLLLGAVMPRVWMSLF